MEVGAAVFASIKRKLHYFGEHSSSSIDSNTSVIDKSNRNIVNNSNTNNNTVITNSTEEMNSRNTRNSKKQQSTSAAVASVGGPNKPPPSSKQNEQAAARNLLNLHKNARQKERKTDDDSIESDDNLEPEDDNESDDNNESDDDVSPLKGAALFAQQQAAGTKTGSSSKNQSRKRRKTTTDKRSLPSTVTPSMNRHQQVENPFRLNEGDSPEVIELKQAGAAAIEASRREQQSFMTLSMGTHGKRQHRKRTLGKICSTSHQVITEVATRMLLKGPVKFLPQIPNYHKFSLSKKTLCGLLIWKIKKSSHSDEPPMEMSSWEGFWETKLLDAFVYHFGQMNNRRLQKMRASVTSRYFMLCAYVPCTNQDTNSLFLYFFNKHVL